MGLVLSAASLMVGAIASVPGLMVGTISSVFSSVYSVPLGYMCFGHWVYVASGYGLPSWYFGCWFSVTTLRQVVASCEWELTQCITDCPDHLLVSVLAILVQVCLDVVSCGFRLSILAFVLSLQLMCVLL